MVLSGRTTYVVSRLLFRTPRGSRTISYQDIYAVTLDQTTVTADGNSGSSTVNLFNQLLFSQDGLDLDKQHQVVLRNQYTTVDPSWVDVDYMIVTSGDGNEK